VAGGHGAIYSLSTKVTGNSRITAEILFLVHGLGLCIGSVMVFIGSQKNYKKCAQKVKRKKRERKDSNMSTASNLN
jgi:hypothetical protein